MTSSHYENDRAYREHIILTIGEGKKIGEVIVDRGHKNGAERHVITDNAIILIYNYRTGRLVTKLVARPSQIRRYFRDGKAPKWLLDIAYKHTQAGYNI